MRTPANAIALPVEKSSVPVLYQELNWSELTNNLVGPKDKSKMSIQAFPQDAGYHSFDTLSSKLTREVVSSNLDLERINVLTEKKRFRNQKYIQNLGEQLLVFRGRGGTGKTVTLIQLAIYLARQNRSSLLITYNHGLISDISRLLFLAAQRDPTLKVLPRVQTRYSFIQDTFIREFGENSERDLVQRIMSAGQDLDDLEAARLGQLLNADAVATEFEFALVDEGQDWKPEQRDLIYRMFGANRVVVADGIDQFVGKSRCRWDVPEVKLKQTIGLRSSLRTKGATCQIVGEIAKTLGVESWDLKPDPEIYGGRLTVLVEPRARSALNQSLRLIEQDIERSDRIQPSDNLLCLPSSKMSGGYNYGWLFDQAIKKQDRNSWRGFDESDRRQYIYHPSQLKAVLYNSCRGMEGWTTVCLALDAFFDFQIRNPRIDRDELKRELEAHAGLFANSNIEREYNKRALEYAVNWVMIPLTRSIDHLVIHITDEDSRLAKILKTVSDRNPNAVEWLYGNSALF